MNNLNCLTVLLVIANHNKEGKKIRKERLPISIELWHSFLSAADRQTE